MQEPLKTTSTDDDKLPSAFHNFMGSGRTPPCPGQEARKRDSGYGTDYSPASATSTSRRFTYDEVESDLDLSEAIEEMDLHESEDVFTDAMDSFEKNQERDICDDAGDDSDDTDKEVEQLFSDSHSLDHSVTQPMHIHRPSAPLPTPEEHRECDDDVKEPECDYLISVPYHHTQWTSRDRHMKRYRFRPIVSRSVGTQTPSPHCQIIREAIGTVNSVGRFQPYPNNYLARGPAVSRLRLHSDGDDGGNYGPLPDIVPIVRDRSVSLPDVPELRRQPNEQEVGRELRRISDEFHSSFTRVGRRRTRSHQYSSLTMNFNIGACWNTIWRTLSSSPLLRRDDSDDRERPETHTSHTNGQVKFY